MAGRDTKYDNTATGVAQMTDPNNIGAPTVTNVVQLRHA